MKVKIGDKQWDYPAKVFFPACVVWGPILMFLLLPVIIWMPETLKPVATIIMLLIGGYTVISLFYTLLSTAPEVAEQNERMLAEMEEQKKADPDAEIEHSGQL